MNLNPLTPQEIAQYRAAHCPTETFNPHKLTKGSVVEIIASGNQGQISNLATYSRSYEGKVFEDHRSMCETEPFEVVTDNGSGLKTINLEAFQIRSFSEQ